MTTEEPHDLTGDLKPRHVRVQQQPIDTLDLERHMTLEHVVMFASLAIHEAWNR